MSDLTTVEFIEDHSVCFSWFMGNHGDNAIYLSNNPFALKRKKYPNNNHIHVISFSSLPEKDKKELVNLCIGFSLKKAKKLYEGKIKLREEPIDWYVLFHINFQNEGKGIICKDVSLESAHDFQYYDGYMNADNCMLNEKYKKIDSLENKIIKIIRTDMDEKYNLWHEEILEKEREAIININWVKDDEYSDEYCKEEGKKLDLLAKEVEDSKYTRLSLHEFYDVYKNIKTDTNEAIKIFNEKHKNSSSELAKLLSPLFYKLEKSKN